MASMAENQVGATKRSRDSHSHLHGPITDFLLLGGGSLFALLAIWYFSDTGEGGITWSISATLAIANIINHPHFAHSYQIFYRNYWEKLTSTRYSFSLRARYLSSGIIFPIVVATFMTWCVVGEHLRILALAANAMFFLVGWHYVKQGYGIAMVDSALKKRFLSPREKNAMLINAYACWGFSWIFISRLISYAAPSYWGIDYFGVPFPTWTVYVAGGILCLTTLNITARLLNRVRKGNKVAWNGIAAYAISLYAWLLIRDPIFLLWIPAFHSLQYLAVVWRYESNRIKSSAGPTSSSFIRFVFFITSGLGLGYAAFWVVPSWLGATVPYNREVFGPSLFFFLFWIFINIHHYMLDTVMWRKGNPDVGEHLFGTGAAKGLRN